MSNYGKKDFSQNENQNVNGNGNGNGNGNFDVSFFMKNSYWKYAIIIILVFIFLIMFSSWTKKTGNKDPSQLKKGIKEIATNASKWASMGKQDTDPLIGLTHTNYALAHFQMVKKLADPKDIERWTKVNIDEMISLLESDQSFWMREIHDKCPSLQQEGVYAFHTDWIF